MTAVHLSALDLLRILYGHFSFGKVYVNDSKEYYRANQNESQKFPNSIRATTEDSAEFTDKRLTSRSESSALTGKGLTYGGSKVRQEAAGFGAVYFLNRMLEHRGEKISGKRIIVSGYMTQTVKRPKGIEVVTINSIAELPKALFME